MMFFLKDIKRFLFFSYLQPMQRYAGKGRDTRPKSSLKSSSKNYGYRGRFFLNFFSDSSKTLVNTSIVI